RFVSDVAVHTQPQGEGGHVLLFVLVRISARHVVGAQVGVGDAVDGVRAIVESGCPQVGGVVVIGGVCQRVALLVGIQIGALGFAILITDAGARETIRTVAVPISVGG